MNNNDVKLFCMKIPGIIKKLKRSYIHYGLIHSSKYSKSRMQNLFIILNWCIFRHGFNVNANVINTQKKSISQFIIFFFLNWYMCNVYGFGILIKIHYNRKSCASTLKCAMIVNSLEIFILSGNADQYPIHFSSDCSQIHITWWCVPHFF